MKFTESYDKENDIWFLHWGNVKKQGDTDYFASIELPYGIVLDCDKNRNVIGIEVFDARKRLKEIEKTTKHYHLNKNWKPGSKEPDYFGCEEKNCKKPITENHGKDEISPCQKCNAPFKRVGPFSWEPSCDHYGKGMRLMCA